MFFFIFIAFFYVALLILSLQSMLYYYSQYFALNIIMLSLFLLFLLFVLLFLMFLGGTPATGYQVYMYEGVGINTLSSPTQVFQEVQMITTNVVNRVYTNQTVFFSSSTWTSFALSINGNTGGVISNSGTYTTAVANYLNSILGYQPIVRPTVNGFTIVFNSGSSNTQTPVVIYSLLPTTVTSNVTQDYMGTDGVGGSFAVSFNSLMSVDLPYNISASDMQVALQDIPGVGLLSVNRTDILINGINRGAYSWIITFNTLPGDLPLLQVQYGRLTSLSSKATIAVSKVVSGTPGRIVYNGINSPQILSRRIDNLVSTQTYAFKVLPFNSLGAGVISKASTTLSPSSGSSAAYTTASGSSLSTGFTYRVDEQQVITAVNCKNAFFSVGYNYMSMNSSFYLNQSTSVLERILTNLNIGDISVIRQDDVESLVPVSR